MKQFSTILFLAYFTLPAQFTKAQSPFNRGVNLTNWFQTSSTRQIQFSKFTKKDFENIKSLGCDVIRLPINLFYMTSGKPNYTIDPLFFDFLDQAVTWTEDLKIYLLLDNHSTDDVASKNPDLEAILVNVWKQMATHYKNHSNYILYEIMNEPNGITSANWGKIQQKAIDAIRQIDTKHTIIVGASNYNSYNDLQLLPVYSDTNLIYTFHFYDPFIFTHQGASWPVPSMVPLTNVPFPYNAASMPQLPDVLRNTWIESAYNNYINDGTVSKIKQLIDVAVAFKTSRNVNVYCGEFGVYIPNSKDADRVYWYSEVRKYLEEKGIAWTTWDYQGGFGLFNKGSNEMFDYDVNIPLVKALGLNEPVQKVFEMKPDSVGFSIYSDFIGVQIAESGYGNGSIINFYSASQPNNGKYCLYWTGTDQYGAVGFNFIPDKDLSKLVTENYALSFLVRGNTPGTKIEARFIDTKTSAPDDHPWRMNYTIGENTAKWDGKWHKVYIPLKNFIDQGSWDNVWYNPIGAFDWKAVDKFEFDSDQGSLKNKAFWFDNISITNMDTAQIYDGSTYVIPTSTTGINTISNASFKIYPNPAKNSTTIYYTLLTADNVSIDIFNFSGQKVKSIINSRQAPGNYFVTWNINDDHGTPVTNGLYICRISLLGKALTEKIAVIRD